MSKLKIEHGASKLQWVLLKTNIEESISTDIDLMCKWSENERKYVVNELLRFALTQSEEFQKYKAEPEAKSFRAANAAKHVPAVANAVHDHGTKPAVPPATITNHP
jgi:hypothetical protein